MAQTLLYSPSNVYFLNHLGLQHSTKACEWLKTIDMALAL